MHPSSYALGGGAGSRTPVFQVSQLMLQQSPSFEVRLPGRGWPHASSSPRCRTPMSGASTIVTCVWRPTLPVPTSCCRALWVAPCGLAAHCDTTTDRLGQAASANCSLAVLWVSPFYESGTTRAASGYRRGPKSNSRSPPCCSRLGVLRSAVACAARESTDSRPHMLASSYHPDRPWHNLGPETYPHQRGGSIPWDCTASRSGDHHRS